MKHFSKGDILSKKHLWKTDSFFKRIKNEIYLTEHLLNSF